MLSVLARSGLSILCLSLSALASAAQERDDLATYRNERYGFSLSYPAGQFSPQASPVNDDGRVFISRDGNARLLAGALPNADGLDLRDYRRFVLKQN